MENKLYKKLKPFPREINKEFCERLGHVNPLFCLLDVATTEFSSELNRSTHPSKFVRDKSKLHGHSHLYTEKLKFYEARRYLFVSHIAFLLTCAEFACRKIQKHQLTKSIDQTDRDKNLGDFIRRTVRIVLLTKTNGPVASPPDSNAVSSILSDTSISLADYYRLIRNTELHASTPEEKVTSPQEFYKTLPIEKIESEYKRKPSVFNQLTFDDVLLCSMALQNIVKALSSGLLSNEMIATLLQKSFGNLDKNRRINAATEFCRQDLLLEQFQIKEVFESLGWLA